MVKQLLYIATIIMTAASPSIATAKQFLCIADMKTGFKLKEGQWKSVNFNVDNDRFVVRENSDTLPKKPFSYAVFLLGKHDPILHCKDSGLNGQWYLMCGGLESGFVFVEEALRFQWYYGSGYVSGDREERTPSLAIGRCSAF